MLKELVECWKRLATVGPLAVETRGDVAVEGGGSSRRGRNRLHRLKDLRNRRMRM